MPNAQQLFEKLVAVPLKDLEQIDLQARPLEQQIKAFAGSSEHVRFLAADVITPQVNAAYLLGLNEKEKAVVGCYYRAYGWMFTMAALMDPLHFQAVAAGARSLFEMWVDIKLLVGTESSKNTKLYHAFPQIERYRVAQKYVTFSDKHPGLKIDCSQQRALLASTSQAKIDDLVIKLWGQQKNGKPIYPDHWSGKDIVSRMAKDSEAEQLYRQHYPLLSWYVHSGSAGFAGLDKEFLQRAFALSHIIAQRASLDSIELVARELKILSAISWLPDAIEKVRMVPGLLLLEETWQEVSTPKTSKRA